MTVGLAKTSGSSSRTLRFPRSDRGTGASTQLRCELCPVTNRSRRSLIVPTSPWRCNIRWQFEQTNAKSFSRTVVVLELTRFGGHPETWVHHLRKGKFTCRRRKHLIHLNSELRPCVCVARAVNPCLPLPETWAYRRNPFVPRCVEMI